MEGKPVTIYDIAKKLGYAPATVSRALNNKKDISEKTRQRIQQAAKEMNYFPNSQAVALSTSKTWNIGVLSVDAQHSGFTHYMFGHVLESIRAEAEENGYDITFIGESVGGQDTTYLKHAKYRNCDGIIIVCINFENPMVKELVEGDIPVVTIDYVFDNCSSVESDNADGLRKIVYYLKSEGHRNIVYFHGDASEVTDKRVNSFIESCKEFNDGGKCQVLEGIYYARTDTYNRTKMFFNNTDEVPSALVFPDDYSAIGGMECIKELGYKIPEDIAVVGFDGIELGELIEPTLTTIKQDRKKMGMYAVQELVRQIENENEPIKRIQVPVKLIERNSSR